MIRQALCASLAFATVCLASGCAQEPEDDEIESARSEAALTNPVLIAARDAAKVGEQANGYLGFPNAADNKGELRALVADINIRRRAAYTEASVRNRMTVAAMGERVACIVFRDKVALGHAYRSDDGVWRTHTAETPMALPSVCR